ncbi:4-aminobutyrate--2-oxoglutarate transaminase [Caldinitratiruptor microaerophilus]|uniref:4-aminobutyrate--2-oxoglutarate transaminase n=1 Tax=Caldinitratiruptor microaerophilus TaxID=671077 RepID=UPI0022315AA5|nr:4-aminobutyrate--2-oxoglutarate transaminase [Caldinitratiruptor microaerophilus]
MRVSRTVQIRTPIPGPRSQELLRRREAAVPRGVANVAPIFAAETRGATLTDVDGNVFLDFAGGIGVLNLGANHPEVVAAVKEQVDRFLHTCFHVTMYEPYVRLAEELNRLTPGDFPKKTALFNSGAEAVENAVKLARRYTGRPAVITFTHAFHGRTLLGMSLTAKVSTYKYGFGPFAPEIYRLPAVYPYRSPFADPAATARHALEDVRRAIEDEIGPDKVAALIIEPVQGEGGFLVQPPEFLRGLRALCDEYGIVFIADEIQTGFGRTGRFFAVEHSGVVPDLVTMAKSLGDGLPISAVTGRAEIMDAAQVGGLGGTYGGNPVACAAALKVIEVMERDRYVERAQAVGERVLARFRDWHERFELVGDVRGLGAMAAIELVKDRATKEPATEETAAIFKRCYENGLILMKAGHHNQVIRFLAPLAITDEQLDEGLDILEEAIASVSRTR